MKSYKKIISAILTIVVLAGCQDYNVLVKNPNLPISAPPSLLLTGILEHMNDQNAWSGKQGSQSASQFYVSTYDYYGTNNYDQQPFVKTTSLNNSTGNNNTNFEYLSVLQNLVQMDVESKNSGKPDLNPYSALGKFLRAFYYNLMSQKMGDVPMSQALQAEKNIAPKYDSQKDVYKQILALLEDANSDLGKLIAANDATLQGDIYLGNSLTSWRKIVNAFTLRVLISLSKKESDSE